MCCKVPRKQLSPTFQRLHKVAMGNKDTQPSFFEEDHSLQQTKPFCVLNLTQNKQSLAACHCSVTVHTSFTPISFLITGCPHVSPASQCPMHEVTTRQPCNLSSGCMTWFLLGVLFLFVLGFFFATTFPECFLLLTRNEQDFLSPTA